LSDNLREIYKLFLYIFKKKNEKNSLVADHRGRTTKVRSRSHPNEHTKKQ
jgi:hypothetical protein